MFLSVGSILMPEVEIVLVSCSFFTYLVVRVGTDHLRFPC